VEGFMMRSFVVGGLAAFAWVQPAVSEAQSPAPQARAIEEIVVTARGREETVRDIPVAITAVSGEDLDRYNLTRFDELGGLIPQLDVVRENSGSGANISMRGIGSTFTRPEVHQLVSGSHAALGSH
jgi:iron complex outermembrane recepter protein